MLAVEVRGRPENETPPGCPKANRRNRCALTPVLIETAPQCNPIQ